MKSCVLWIPTAAFVLVLFSQCVSAKDCVCELKNVQPPFPMEKLESFLTSAFLCTKTIGTAEFLEVDVLMLGLQKRMEQVEKSVSVLEKEDDGDLYGAVSLRIIELELAEILELMSKLNTTINSHRHISHSMANKLHTMTQGMRELEALDISKVVDKERENLRVKRALAKCQEGLQTTPTTPPPRPRHCPQGQLVNVTGPHISALTEYGTSYTFGAWGKDPKPPLGKEDSYWLVPVTSGYVYSNFIRHYSSLSTLLAGKGGVNSVISSPNPSTNTAMGPNVVMYAGALYYNCYYSASLCRFDVSTRSITSLSLPATTGYSNMFPFGNVDDDYIYTDLDLETDESGVWIVYSTKEHMGNVVLSEVKEGSPPSLGRTWKTSLYKRSATNTFMACGVLYATRFRDKQTEEVFYSYDTVTGEERFNLNIRMKKTQANIQSMNYNPRDRILYAYSDAYVVTYNTVFQ